MCVCVCPCRILAHDTDSFVTYSVVHKTGRRALMVKAEALGVHLRLAWDARLCVCVCVCRAADSCWIHIITHHALRRNDSNGTRLYPNSASSAENSV